MRACGGDGTDHPGAVFALILDMRYGLGLYFRQESMGVTGLEQMKYEGQPADATPSSWTMSHEVWLKIDLFERLSRSDFRSRFRLSAADKAYLKEKGSALIRTHAEEIIRKRLAPAEPKNDGKQTPMRGAPRGHPVFLAQHATATCCRGCLEKWHGIPKGRELSEQEQTYVVNVLMKWLGRQFKR